MIANQRKAYGVLVAEHNVVAKVLRSLTPHFDHVVATIEESEDLTSLTIEELSSSLQAHEARMNSSVENLKNMHSKPKWSPPTPKKVTR